MDREWIEKEITMLEAQKEQHQNMYVQAVGAIMAYKAMLTKMAEQNGVVDEVEESQNELAGVLPED